MFGFEKPHKVFHKHGFTRTALTDNQIHLTVVKLGADVVQHLTGAIVEKFIEMFYFNHNFVASCALWVYINKSLVRITSLTRMMMLLITTASVLALPTSTEPPFTV